MKTRLKSAAACAVVLLAAAMPLAAEEPVTVTLVRWPYT